MPERWVATQLAVGNSERTAFSDRHIGDVIARARDLARIDALLIWPGVAPGGLETIARACRSQGITPLLWFPVLCDLPGGSKQRADSLVENCEAHRGHGRAGAWEGLDCGDEHFLFSCPNHEPSLQASFDAYASLLASAGVDGVMLDRIRFPAPSNGLESLLGCFCESCRSRFRAETGQSMAGLREKAAALLGGLRETGPRRLCAEWAERGSFWKAAGLEELAAFRERSITRAVGRFSAHARSRGIQVGLDLFSPTLAPLVGQDYLSLGGLCDWIKPMTYCRAVGPAGLPLEIACLRRGFLALSPSAEPDEVNRALKKVLGWEFPDEDSELLRQGLAETVIASELQALRPPGSPDTPRVYPGIEAVRMPAFGIDITAEILERTLRALPVHAEGIVASWNLLHIPEENLAVLGGWRG